MMTKGTAIDNIHSVLRPHARIIPQIQAENNHSELTSDVTSDSLVVRVKLKQS